MKRTLLLIALCACALTVQAKPGTASASKPTAAKTDKKAKPADKKEATKTKETAKSKDTPKTEEKPADKTEPAEGEQPAAGEEEQKPVANTADQIEGSDFNNVKDITIRLRKDLEEMDKQLKEISKPSSGLVSNCRSVRSRVERNLAEMDKLALEVVELQEKFRLAGSGDYRFSEVTTDDREAYSRDGTAAYKAMVADMKEKKGRRKVGGLDKFELMRDRYQGVPEYKDAYDWYIKTLGDLSKKWKKMLTAEQARRKNLPSKKKEAMEEADDKELEKLGEQFKKDGEDIASVWYTPSPRNEAQLRNCVNKVEDALRRNKGKELEEEVGKVPGMLTEFWNTMEEARKAMMSGDLENAESILRDDDNYRTLSRLKSSLLPEEYKKPLTKERDKLLKEIQNRSRTYRSTKTTLERKSGTLERMIDTAEAQLKNVMEAIAAERDTDVGEKTAEVEEPDDEEEEESAKDGKKDAKADKDAKDSAAADKDGEDKDDSDDKKDGEDSNDEE